MSRRKQSFFWHVGVGMWSDAEPGGSGFDTVVNVGKDIILVLVDTVEATGDEPAVPENDNFVVERIIGQWNLRSTEPIARDYYIHERVYVV